MEIRRWDFANDKELVSSFLRSAALAHKIEEKSQEWFYWKFRDCPYGEAIVVCAFDDKTIAGCIAMGRWQCEKDGVQMVHGGAFETFVHPGYQGRGLFLKLIAAVESACEEEGIQFITTFPNTNSIRGYVKMGHIPLNILQCKMLLLHPIKTLCCAKSLKRPFVPNKQTIVRNVISDRELYNESKKKGVRHKWTKAYLKWRFEGLSGSEYYIQDTDAYFAVARVGYRGAIKECQIIYIDTYEDVDLIHYFNVFCKYLIKNASPDIITCSHSRTSALAKCTRLFIPVPTKVNFAVKSLDPELEIGDDIDIRAIAFHTY